MSSSIRSTTWKQLQGIRRIQAEYKHMCKAAVNLSFVKGISLIGDTLNVWRLQLHNFDDALPGGRQLNADLKALKARCGQDHLLLEIEFPNDYPTKPFFVRLVSPRCKQYTRHVTVGGSICLASLTLSGTPGSWQPDYSVESLLHVIVLNLIDRPVVWVDTPNGRGGMSGPLKVDLTLDKPQLGYSSSEARMAFQRVEDAHGAV